MHKIEETLKNKFQNDDTFLYYDIKKDDHLSLRLYYIFGLVDNDKISNLIIKPVTLFNTENLCMIIKNYNIDEIIKSLLDGNVIVFDYNNNTIKSIDVKKHYLRSVSEPDNEKVVKGPKEGFIENIISNINLIRTRLRTNQLKFEFLQNQNPMIAICYIDEAVDKNVLRKLKNEIKKYNFENININHIKEQLKNNKKDLFNTVGDSGRVDVCTYKLLEGKIVILVDGSPLCLYLPFTFSENFQTVDDYYLSFSFASINRVLRFISFIISIILPGFYVAVLKFHQELLPVELMISISASRIGVPFSTFFECVLLLTAFEILREAGTKISSLLGSSLSIVGGLVIGQATVEARIISTSVVIIVAISSITTLINSKLSGPIICYRYIVLVMGALVGIYGILASIIFMITKLIKMDSFGEYYIKDILPFKLKRYKKTYTRFPDEM